MLEMGLANPVNYNKMDVLLSNHPEFVQSFQNLLFEMSRQLLLISEAGQNVRKIPKNDTLINCFKKLKKNVSELKSSSKTEDYEGFLMLQNLLEYQENQIEKIQKINVVKMSG
ncbi:MAG TPA: hypothetical protein DEG69_13780 [Flavobacteriaceae bacterium]|nr:hypothetical protein [Flavobacteriaceae bacterium]